jgi:hypothetical protein
MVKGLLSARGLSIRSNTVNAFIPFSVLTICLPGNGRKEVILSTPAFIFFHF